MTTIARSGQGAKATADPTITPLARLSESAAQLIHSADLERSQRAWEQARRSEAEYSVEYRLRRFDGVFRWHECRALPVRNGAGVVTAWIGTVTDIEERKQLELALRRSEQGPTETPTAAPRIEPSAPVGFKLVDYDLWITRINERFSQVQDHTAAEDLGGAFVQIVADLWRDVVIGATSRENVEDARRRGVAASVEAIARAVEYRDPYTAGHQRRVAAIAGAIADELGLDRTTAEGVKTAASIHDVGKIAIPAELLSKPGPLSISEFALIKVHAEVGYNIVAGIDFPWPVPEMIRQHHERLDGSGYPRGLPGDQILLGARIIAVADTVDAMATNRPYRRGHGIDAALAQVEQDRGTRLDPNVVDACLSAYVAGRFCCN